jgi:hypothetical protein
LNGSTTVAFSHRRRSGCNPKHHHEEEDKQQKCIKATTDQTITTTTIMNTTTSIANDTMAFPNETLNPALFSPTTNSNNSVRGESVGPQRATTNTAMTILFLLGCLCIAVLWAIVAARNYRPPRIANEEGDVVDHNTSLEDLEKQMLQQFADKGNHVVLKTENFHAGDTESDSAESSDENDMAEIDLETGDSDGHIVIQKTSEDGKSTKDARAPNLCTICLESYQAGDTVTWSTNEHCSHMYHQVCLAKFFAHGKKKGHKQCICPTCRQEYIVIENKGNTTNQTKQQHRGEALALPETHLMRQQRISAILQ